MSAYKIAQTILYACSGIPLDHCLNREVKAGMMLKEAAWRLPNGQGTRINLTQNPHWKSFAALTPSDIKHFLDFYS